jgi:flagellar hook-length control protein FliK
LPLKGALPQPIKTPALPVDLNQPNNLAETLKDSVTQALARVQANQLSSIPKDPTTQPSFLVDLPVSIDENSAEVIPMLIEEEEAHSGEECEKNTWSITLALDMENLGTLQVKVSLIADKIDVNIWADLEETRQLFEQKNYLLADALQQENLLIRTLAYHLGLQENEIETESFNMLDIKI